MLVDFAAVTSNVKLYLFSTYCMDAYGFSLWDYSNQYVEFFVLHGINVLGDMVFTL